MSDILNRVRLLATRAIINFMNPSNGGIQTAQADLLADETRDDIERISEFGFNSRPPKGSEAVILAIGGVRSNGIIIGTNHRDYHFILEDDGSAVMHDANGQYILMTADGIKIFTDKKITIDAPTTDWTGDINLTGDIIADGISLKNHKHSGVQAGTAQTGKPV